MKLKLCRKQRYKHLDSCSSMSPSLLEAAFPLVTTHDVVLTVQMGPSLVGEVISQSQEAEAIHSAADLQDPGQLGIRCLHHA